MKVYQDKILLHLIALKLFMILQSKDEVFITYIIEGEKKDQN